MESRLTRFLWIFFKNGEITGIGTILIFAGGGGLIYLSLKYLRIPALAFAGICIGYGMMGFAGYAGWAKGMKLRPFTDDPLGWREAKKTYAKPEDNKDD